MWLRLSVVLAFVATLAAVTIALAHRRPATSDAPWRRVARPSPHVDHSQLIAGPFEDGPAVTRACLECHPNAAREVMQTGHWTWAGQKARLPGRSE